MTNNVRVKMLKMEMLAELVDRVINSISAQAEQLKGYREQLENGETLCSWEKADMEAIPVKISAYEDLIKSLEKLA